MAYIYDLTDTWSAGGTVFNAIKMNVTDSASAVASKLVSLQTNGTEHFSVTKAGAGYFSGNVGIGVTPLANTRIYVRTATVTDTAYYADNGANSGFKVKFASSLTSILNDFGADLVLGTNDTERMRIAAGGSVGIGTSSPDEKLRVEGNVIVPISKSFFSYTNNYGIGTPDSNGLQIFTDASDVMRLGHRTGGTTFTERMRIDTSGNVGIGVTPAAHGSSERSLDIGNTTSFGRQSDAALAVNFNSFLNASSQYIYRISSFASSYQQLAGQHKWFNAPSGTAGNAISFTQAMTLDASGNLGIGTSSPDVFGRFYTRSVGINSSGTSMLQINGTTYGGIDLGFNGTRTATMLAETGGLFIQTVTAAAMSLGTNGTERMRITSAGDVGIGTSSPSTKLTVTNGAITAGASGDVLIGRFDNSFPNVAAGYFRLRTNNTNGSNGGITFDTLLSDVLTERMRIDSSGNVGIGTSSPGAKLDVLVADGAEATKLRGATGRMRIRPYVDATNGSFIDAVNTAENAYIPLSLAGSSIRLTTNSGLAATVDASGNLLVGTTSVIGTVGDKLQVVASGAGYRAAIFKSSDSGSDTVGVWNTATTGDNVFSQFYTEANGSLRGSITYNRTGGVVAYNTTSDYRAKDILGPVTDAGATIDALKIYSGKMKGATIERPMLIAHEAQEVVPYAVTGEKDAINEDGTDKYQQMDHQILIPLLIAEIQSLRARVAQLEGN